MIINSLLDTDFYKFTQGQVALHQFPSAQVKYKFKCRTLDAEWGLGHLIRIRQEIDNFCSLRFTEDELDYLKSIRFFKPSYIDFLRLYRPDRNHISVNLSNGALDITVEGPWFLTIYFEVPVLAIVSEIYTEHISLNSFPRALDKLKRKAALAETSGFPYADFGTRRRFSREWHDLIVETLKTSDNFKGTSNVLMAKNHDVTPIGTMAHEFFMVAQALDVSLVGSQKLMLQAWVNEYRGDLGIALTDVISTDTFLKGFDLYFAKLYDGLRQDSGSPYEWADKVIKHYRDLGVDPLTKSLIFSDGLDFELCRDIYERYKDDAKISFGVGTNLTNDLGALTPLQNVMKIVECNGQPVAKISDSPGKGMCEDADYVTYLKKVFGL